MKLLSGTQLAADIKRRHTSAVKKLGRSPKLAIVQVKDDPAINLYVRLKRQYGSDIGAEVEVHRPSQIDAPTIINKLNTEPKIDGIIVQLPLADPSQTDEIVNLVAPTKDVDALGKYAEYTPATPMAIMWLLEGNSINLHGKRLQLVGRGKLVGSPLEKLLKEKGYAVRVADAKTVDLASQTKAADIVITATGSPGIITADMLKANAVVVDAGVASEAGKTVGDLAPDVYRRDDLTLTPPKGGVGPLTVCALFENVIKAASNN